ncbi:MAG TPA: hypothetical protein VKR42_08390 [Ktedonobacteraceae bacterium]|nr:hypothetical protein [Ktedonobacteraceae bacterium]
MVSLKPLELVGYSQAFFKLPLEADPKQAYTWYTFDTVYPPDKELHWNLIGLRQRRENTLFFDVQWFFVDDDELAMKEFEPVQYANRFLSINPSELLALIEFFENAPGSQVTAEDGAIRHFHLLGPDELRDLHFKQWAIDMYAGHCYRYIPDQDIQNAASIILFKFPQWIQNHKLTHGTILKMMMFDRQQLADSEFSPSDTYGLATITFTEQALKEFIVLLKQRTYEAALRAFQS